MGNINLHLPLPSTLINYTRSSLGDLYFILEMHPGPPSIKGNKRNVRTGAV